MTLTMERLSGAGEKSGKTPKHFYTEDELEYIRKNYQGTNASAAAIAEYLGLSIWGIKGQVQKLGITRQKSPDWTPEELEKLEELIHKYSVHTVAKELHRSQNAIKVKATRLGMKLREHYGWYTKRQVCEMLGEDHHVIQAYIDRRELKACWHGQFKPQANGCAPWHIEKADLRDFIIRHSGEFVGRNIDLQQIVGILIGEEKMPVISLKGSTRSTTIKCPRCGGRIIKDAGGVESSCLNCGYVPTAR